MAGKRKQGWIDQHNSFHRYANPAKTACTDPTLASPDKRELQAACSTVLGHRPIHQFGSPDSTTKVAKYIVTPGGSKLYLSGIYGTLHVYSQHTPSECAPIENAPLFIKLLTKLGSHVTLEGVVPPPDDAIKVVTKEVDLDSLNNIREEIKIRRFRRNKSQSRVMSEGTDTPPVTLKEVKKALFDPTVIDALIIELCLSADEENKTRQWIERLRPEWLHLVDYASLGDKAQYAGNLVLGTWESNTQMMVVEALVKMLAEKYPDETITLSTQATLIPGTHLCKKIDYQVSCNSFSKVFTFTPLSQRQPPVQAKAYLAHASRFYKPCSMDVPSSAGDPMLCDENAPPPSLPELAITADFASTPIPPNSTARRQLRYKL